MDDLISRQAVKLAIVEKGQASRRYKLGETWELNREEAWEAIDSVPSAQPKTRCVANITITDEQVKEILEKAKAEILDAQPERKKGKWILWNYPGEECARCSVCGEEYDQMDLYIGGNDYPKFCPECGAKMEVEK